jgi:hypothetical protein
MINCVLIQKSTRQIINPNANYPRVDGEPVVGLDPDLLYLAKYTPYPEPDYDSRAYVLVTLLPDIATINFDSIPAHPSWPNIKEYRITYTTQLRTVDDLKLSVTNAESMANEAVFPDGKRMKAMLLAIASLIKLHNGLTLNTKEQNNLDKVAAYSVKVWKNDKKKKDKEDEIDASVIPNFDEGWENTEA